MNVTNRWKWLNFAGYIAVLTVNALANLIPLGGSMTGDVAKAYPNLMTPAAYTFAIWGVIYLLMGFFVLHQWGVIGNRKAGDAATEVVGPWFMISCIMNIVWIFFWHFDLIGLSVLAIAGLLTSLIVIEKRTEELDGNFWDRLSANIFFDIYFGWILVAALLNISVFFTKLQWNGFGLTDQFWAAVILLVGALAAGAEAYIKNRNMTGAAVIWAYVGIIIRHVSANGFDNRYPLAIIAGIVGITLIFAAIVMKSTDRYYDITNEVYPFVKYR